MRRRLALLLVLAALGCRSRAPDPVPATTAAASPMIPRPAPPGPLAATAPAERADGAEPRGLVGPRGTLGVEHYRRRRQLLLDKVKTGAALIDGDWDDEANRSGSSFYYLTGIDERGASLLLQPRAPTFKETLYLRGRDVETEQWDGERSPLPSRALELSTGIGRIARDATLPPSPQEVKR
jgi:hypothetical protein